MFGIGTTELLIIMLVALIVLGPKQLPGIARSLGKALGEFRRVTTDVQRTLNLEAAKIEEDEREKKKATAAAWKAEKPEAPAEESRAGTQPAMKPESASPSRSAVGEESIPPSEQVNANPYGTPHGEAATDDIQPQPTPTHVPSREGTSVTNASSSSETRETSPAGEPEKTVHPSESSTSKVQA